MATLPLLSSPFPPPPPPVEVGDADVDVVLGVDTVEVKVTSVLTVLAGGAEEGGAEVLELDGEVGVGVGVGVGVEEEVEEVEGGGRGEIWGGAIGGVSGES